MADSTLNRFLARGTNAERLAFTPTEPTPASGPDPLYVWFETDTGETYSWDGADWVQSNVDGNALHASNNLSDLANAATARTNLDVYSKAETDALDATTLSDANTYTDAAVSAISGGGEGAALNGVVSGCSVVYSGTALTFDMSAGSYYLDGTLLSAAAQSITLNAADATHPRIDVLYLDDTGTLSKLTGTAAASPSQPAVDPTSELFLTFVLVPATATDLNTGIVSEDIYLENTEWATSQGGAGLTLASTNNPFAGTKCIEVTGTFGVNSYVQFDRASPMAFGGDGNLTLRIRSKAAWNAKRGINFQWYDVNGVAVGAAVTLRNGTYGFDSSNTSTYQLVALAKSLFAIEAGTEVDKLRGTAIGTGGSAITFYLDNVILQTTGDTTSGGTVSGITQEQADARYVKLSGGTMSGALAVPADAYGAGWNGSNEVPTKNDVYDKIQAVIAGAGTGDMLSANNLSDVASVSTSRTNLGATTVGANLFTLTNPSAIRFLRLNADNSVSTLDAATFRTAIGAGSGGGDLVSTNNLSDVASATTSRTNLGVGTGDSPQFTAINLGHASDTTIARTGAGDIAIEGNAVYRAGGTDVPVTDGGTGASTASAARTNLAAAAAAQTEEQISGFIASPSDKSYTIALDMKHAGTITQVTTKSASGTCTATWKINTTALGGTANSVSSSEQSQTHSSSNAFAAGDDIVLTVSSNSSCADMSFTIKYSRTLA